MCVNMCVHKCLCVLTCAHVYMCMCTHVHVHACLSVHVYVCVCAHAQVCVCTCTCVHVCVCVSAAWEVPQGGIQQGPPLPHSRFFWELPACGTGVQAEPRFVMDPVEEVLSRLEGGGSTSLLGP